MDVKADFATKKELLETQFQDLSILQADRDLLLKQVNTLTDEKEKLETKTKEVSEEEKPLQ